MTLSLHAVTSSFVAEVGDVDLRNELAAGDLAAIRAAFATYAVLVFPAQDLSAVQHLAFARNFGPIEPTVDAALKRENTRVLAGIADIANIDTTGKLWNAGDRMRSFQMLANRLWHTDSSFKQPSGYASLLYARSIAPVGGNTEFADLRAAYDALAPETKRRIGSLVAEHSILNSRRRLGMAEFTDAERAAFTPVLRPLVRTIPESSRATLYIASHVGRIEGVQAEEASALLDALLAHATQPQFVYAHRWRVGDLLLWDNRCTMHRGRDFDDLRWPRDLQRVTTSDRIDAFAGAVRASGARASY